MTGVCELWPAGEGSHHTPARPGANGNQECYQGLPILNGRNAVFIFKISNFDFYKNPPNSGNRYPNTAGQQRDASAAQRARNHQIAATGLSSGLPPGPRARIASPILLMVLQGQHPDPQGLAPAHADPPSRSPAQTLLCPPSSILHCPLDSYLTSPCWSRGPLDLTGPPDPSSGHPQRCAPSQFA